MNLAQVNERLEGLLARLRLLSVVTPFVAALVVGGAAYRAQQDVVPASGQHSLEQLQAISQSVALATVREQTRGKAVFRTTQAVDRKIVDELAHYVLTGTSKGRGAWKAFVRDTRAKKMHVLKVGDSLGSVFKVIGVAKGEITLQRGDEEITLKKG